MFKNRFLFIISTALILISILVTPFTTFAESNTDSSSTSIYEELSTETITTLLTQSTLSDEYTTEENSPETTNSGSTTLEENTTEETTNIADITETTLNETLLSDETLTMHTIESETLTEPADASPFSLVEFWIEDTSGNKVYEAVLKPGQSKTFELHNQFTGSFSKNATWSLSANRGSLSNSTGAECTFTAGNTTGTTTLTSTLKDGTTYSIKIYITKTLDIIRPGDHATNPYGDISYEHIYVGASKTMRGNTVENRESNSDLLAYWTTGGHDDLVSRAWSNSRKCWTTQTITGLKAGTFNLAIKATTQNSIMAQIPVTVIEQISPNRLGFVDSAQKLRVATPTTASDVDVFCGAAVTIKGQVGNYWYVTFGNYWGFLPKSSVYDYPYATYSGIEHEYYLYNRDLMLQVTEFNDGPASYPNDYKLGILDFAEKYQKNLSSYQQIADRTNVPAILIAAIHYRESGCDFKTTIKNGNNLPTGETFIDNAVNEILDSGSRWIPFQEDIAMGKNTKNLLAMLQFAELWNGTACANQYLIHNKPIRINPYVYAGTNLYTSGKFVADNDWSGTAYDRQPGIYYLLIQFYS